MNLLDTQKDLVRGMLNASPHHLTKVASDDLERTDFVLETMRTYIRAEQARRAVLAAWMCEE